MLPAWASPEWKIIFDKSRYDGGRYRVECGVYGDWGITWERGGSYEKKSSAIAEAERLISKGEYDRVVVIDTKKE